MSIYASVSTSFAASISAVFAETVIAFLLPWLLPAAAGDLPTARAAAIELLAESQPGTARELRLAGEVIVHSLKAMALLSGTQVPGASIDSADPPLKAATSLARHSHLAQRRLDELQRIRRAAAAQPATQQPEPSQVPLTELHAPATAIEIQIPDAASLWPQTAGPMAPETDLPAPAQAEATYADALQQLTLMKARWKGAPQPHTKAGQDIQRQQRSVDIARMALAQSRRSQIEAAA